MFETYRKGPKCPMCNKTAIKLHNINGQKGCRECKKKIEKGQEIIKFKNTNEITKVEKYHNKYKKEQKKENKNE